MQEAPAQLIAAFDARLDQAHVPQPLWPSYHKWAKFYLLFCQKYEFSPTAPTALGPFLTKLAAKGYSIEQRHHATAAVKLLVRPDPQDPSLYLYLSNFGLAGSPPAAVAPIATSRSAAAWACRPAELFALSKSLPNRASWEREFHDLESSIKLRNYSRRTLEAYRFWVMKFQAFVRSRPTAKLSNQEVRGFLSSLAVQQNASASSQNQAFNALLFFFRHVLTATTPDAARSTFSCSKQEIAAVQRRASALSRFVHSSANRQLPPTNISNSTNGLRVSRSESKRVTSQQHLTNCVRFWVCG